MADKQPDSYSTKSKVDLPTDFEDEGAFVQWVRETFEDDLAADSDNREAAMEDSAFLAGEQWDELDEAYRKDKRLPVLTVNQLPAFVGTVIGNRRMNEVTVNVSPDSATGRGKANLREGIIRSVLKNSVAKRAFDKAFENQVTCGIGNFGVGLDYATNDVFEQDICVYMIPHALAVVWDRFSTDPTGRDARHCFISEQVANKDFEARWPDAKGGEFGSDVDQWARTKNWVQASDKRVVTVWRMNQKSKTLALFSDGQVRNISGQDPQEINMQAQQQMAQLQAAAQAAQQQGQQIDPSQLPKPPATIVQNPKTGQLMVRESPVLVAQRWVVTAGEILEGPYELPIDRVPIFRCNGWEINVGPRRVRWGLVRLAKDAQRLFNFWRSVVAEKLLYSPKATVMGPASAFEGRLEEWKNAHLKREPLMYNEDTPAAPQFVPPSPPDVALLQQASMALDDMRNTLNLHEANLGLQSNEVSAKAIMARAKLGELGTVVYNDNMNDAVEECGRVINQLIPVCYDTPRIIKVTGFDDKEEMAAINENDENDVTSGKYTVTLNTGPSYVTKRQEAAEAMLTFVNAAPQIAAVAPDLIVEAQDWPNAEAIAARFRRALPPHLLGPEDMTPDQAQAAEQEGMLNQVKTQLALEGANADIASKKAAAVHSAAMAEEAQARAIKARAEASVAVHDSNTDRMKVVGDMIDNERSRLTDLYKTERQGAMQLERDRTVHQRLNEQGAQ